MFDSVAAAAATAVTCADALAASVTEERRVVAQRYALVAAWADLHLPDEQPHSPEGLPAALSPRRRLEARERTAIAAEGTPRVTRSGVVELGILLGTSPGSALALLRDVLELRHRLPCHWAAVQELTIDGWKARQVAVLTHRLNEGQARAVDAQVLEAVTGLPWGRAKDVVEGRVIAADKAAHAARLAEDENRRFVSTRRRSNVAGLRTMIARCAAGDMARLEAMIAHLAGRLEGAGDTSHLDIRRAKALAMLANPALTCVFLAQPHPARPAGDTDNPDAGEMTVAAAEHEPISCPADEDEPAGHPSAVELATAFGHQLKAMGSQVIDRLRPKAVLYLHLAAEAVQVRRGCGVVRVDDPLAGGPISTAQLKAWLGHDRVTVRPVIDPTDCEPVNGYEIPLHMREAVRLLNPVETSPWGTSSSRQADQDHSIPYVPMDKGGPPGQTALTNLGPLGRTTHLAKTFDGFVVHQLAIGLYLWRSPTGHWCQVDHRGTRALGRDPDGGRPAAIDTAERLDPTAMRPAERWFRDLIVRHVAA